MTARRPHILGLGGATRPASSTERFLSLALGAAAEAGATTTLLSAEALQLPLYEQGHARCEAAQRLVAEVRRADGIILASPAYHGTVSGLVKNALDYVEETRADARPYFSDRAIGCLAVAGGWQAAVGTMNALRGIAHALRGWPTPLGVAIHAGDAPLDAQGACASLPVTAQIQTMARQVVAFARQLAAQAEEEAPDRLAA